MTDKRSSESRRKLLKSIAAGSGAIVAGKSLPESWSRPVVDSVMLPAHAQTSPPPPVEEPTFGGAALSVVLNDMDNDSMLAQLTNEFADTFISPAHAGGSGNGGGSAAVCAPKSGSMLDVTIQTAQNNARRNGMLSIDGTPGNLDTFLWSESCGFKPDNLKGQIRDYDAKTGFTLRIAGTGNGGFPDSYAFEIFVPLDACPGFQDLDGPCEGD